MTVYEFPVLMVAEPSAAIEYVPFVPISKFSTYLFRKTFNIILSHIYEYVFKVFPLL